MKNASRRSSSLRSVVATLVVLLPVVVGGAISDSESSPQDHDEQPTSNYYIRAGAEADGDGSESRPFASLQRAEAVSSAGDVIYLMAGGSTETLDGGIALKPRQRLIGLGPNGRPASVGPDMVRLTNSTEHLDGVIVMLSEANEVAGIHFVDMQHHAILGAGTSLSETHIHHNLFSGAAQSEEIIWSVRLESESGSVGAVRVTDSVFRDGDSLGGIQVMHRGDSSGEYLFERNRFTDLGGRAYHIWSLDSSRIRATILDSEADNIGVGDRNSDSILPHLCNSSQQHVVVRDFHYRNTKQVGNVSNTGLEAFIMGAPFTGEESWCNGCQLTLEITDSVFEDAVTDGIQLINFGSNSVLDFRIKNTKVIGAKPRQVGGGISLVPQNDQNTGSSTRLLIENTDIIDSAAYGFAVTDQSDGSTSIVDLGGGELGSAGHNRIIDSSKGEVQVLNAKVVAKHNWWGGNDPRVELQGDSSTVEWQPALTSDPGGD
jgi:hypothetical protein